MFLERDNVLSAASKSVLTASYAMTKRSQPSVSKLKALGGLQTSNINFFAVKLMIPEIGKFNEAECKRRTEKIASSHNFCEFKTAMDQRLTVQYEAARHVETLAR